MSLLDETKDLIRLHNLSDGKFVHSDLQVSNCACARLPRVVLRPPTMDGSTCSLCGGMMVRTGSCHTCTSCGTTGGCG